MKSSNSAKIIEHPVKLQLSANDKVEQTMPKQKRLNLKTMSPIIALVLILVATAILSPGFLQLKMVDGHLYGSLIDIIHRGMPTALVALGMAVVIGTGGIDLSVGAITAIAGAVMAVLLSTSDLSPIYILLIALASGLAFGLWNGLLVAYVGMQPIVATLILMVAGRGIAQMITGGQIVTFHSDFFNLLGNEFIWLLPTRVWILLGVALLVAIVIRKTALGLFLEAVGANPTSSRLVGIESKKIITLAYVFSGLCSALAGVILAADIRGADANNAGLWLELDAILAVVIAGASLAGGRIYLGLTLIGVLIIQTLTTAILTSGIPAQYNLIVKATIILLVLLIQSSTTQDKFKQLFKKNKESA
ncbi:MULTISPECIES: ABC transporter permease [unclassified Agarivorans]|uniref:ABC transporter permease n=1 Tax=unclassified Agarivorans TaxID=2636026 RepID=UPI003D7E7FA6